MLLQQGPHWGFCQRVPAPLSWALTQWPKGRSHQKCDITGDHGAAGARKLVDDLLETTLDSSVFCIQASGCWSISPKPVRVEDDPRPPSLCVHCSGSSTCVLCLVEGMRGKRISRKLMESQASTARTPVLAGTLQLSEDIFVSKDVGFLRCHQEQLSPAPLLPWFILHQPALSPRIRG